MSEHQPPPSEPGPVPTDDADEAELIRKVLRTQERHREGGVDPELDEDAGGLASGQAAGASPAGSEDDG